ncbi:MAG: sugar nucleotide-binding protein [Corynebacterium glucuronolyticum]|nr:NAD(P)-dependent oxidoreductase [Corynebacterium glucuronolyticum]MDD7586099.1 sugar nucleotide-binding protein [Mycobacteriaceae bacterium]MDY5833510.1 sugar nucleotide-binding protein [Corynebacterium glucuronolyticum]
MEIAVLGQGGQLGTALRLTNPGFLLRLLGRGDIDLAALAAGDRDVTRRAKDALLGVGCVVNCAARTDVDKQESDSEGAEAVNHCGVARLGELTAARLIHVSTDYVFGSGAPRRPLTPEDPTAPDTVYGVSKLAGERELAGRENTLIARTAWLFSGDCLPSKKDFVSTMLRLAREGKPARVVDDQMGSPTFAFDLARGLWEAVDSEVTGVYHTVGAGQATWCEVARATYQAAGADPERVTPCTSEEYPQAAKRPPWSVLDTASWELAGFTPFPEWRSGVERAVAGRIQ